MANNTGFGAEAERITAFYVKSYGSQLIQSLFSQFNYKLFVGETYFP